MGLSKAFEALLIAFTLLSIFCLAGASPTYANITITAPEGTSNHGDPRLLCVPSRWYHIAGFYFTNFIAHAATLRSFPGESPLAVAMATVVALLCPTFGVVRGLSGIIQRAVFSDGPLKSAQRAGALWMVVRSNKWQPQDGDEIEFSGISTLDEKIQEETQRYPAWMKNSVEDSLRKEISSSDRGNVTTPHRGRTRRQDADANSVDHEVQSATESTPEEPLRKLRVFVRARSPGMDYVHRPSTGLLDIRTRRVHGQCRLPHGYALAMVPNSAHVESLGDPPAAPTPQPWYQRFLGFFRYSTASLLLSLLPPQNFAQILEELEDPESQRRRKLAEAGRDYEADRKTWRYGSIQRLSRIQQSLQRMRETGMEALSMSKEGYSDDISCSYSFAKALVAVLQIFSAAFSLYRARGDQINRYGYAAFGLTVSPYLVMSFVNGLSSLLTPSYPAVYLVETDVMKEASRREGGFFSGQVGVIKSSSNLATPDYLAFSARSDGRMIAEVRKPPPPPAMSAFLSLLGHTEPTTTESRFELDSSDDSPAPFVAEAWPGTSQRLHGQEGYYVSSLLSYWVGLTPLAIIGGLSQFHAGSSSKAQRVWTMVWLAMSVFAGPTAALADVRQGLLLSLFYVGAPAIGGFVVIGKMMSEYGHCVKFY